MSRARERHGALVGRFPRVSGDEPTLVSVISGAIKFSPRERG